MNCWNVENPAHRLASVYGNRWLSVGRHYEDENVEFCKINVEIDAHGLTLEETNLLCGTLEDIALYRCKDDWEGYTGELKLEDVETDEDDDYPHVFRLNGYVTEDIYEEIYSVLDDFSDRIAVIEIE